jgi:hypothetical protein
MMYDRVDSIDADPDVGGLAIPQPPVQALNFPDDRGLRRLPRRMVARQTAGVAQHLNQRIANKMLF